MTVSPYRMTGIRSRNNALRRKRESPNWGPVTVNGSEQHQLETLYEVGREDFPNPNLEQKPFEIFNRGHCTEVILQLLD